MLGRGASKRRALFGASPKVGAFCMGVGAGGNATPGEGPTFSALFINACTGLTPMSVGTEGRGGAPEDPAGGTLKDMDIGPARSGAAAPIAAAKLGSI